MPGPEFDTRPVLASALPTAAASTGPAAPTAQAVWELHDQWVTCLMTPAHCQPDRVTEPGSPIHRHLTEVAAQRQAEGLEAAADHLPPRRALMRTWPTGDAWYVELCWVDDLVLFDGMSRPGQRIVVDDGVVTLTEAWTLRPHGTAWRIVGRDVVQVTPGDHAWCR